MYLSIYLLIAKTNVFVNEVFAYRANWKGKHNIPLKHNHKEKGHEHEGERVTKTRTYMKRHAQD